MTIDRRDLKTPFFKIEVGPGSQLTELPMQLLKLVSKIEITEFSSGCNHNQLKLSFIEGSREPFEHSEEQSAPIYPGGSFTNASGMIVDLKEVGGGGGSLLTSLSQGAAQAAAAVGAIAGVAGGVFGGDNVEEEDAAELINNSSPKFLFSPRNRVKVTWGYIEDPQTVRSFSGRVQIMRTNFPENGHPITEIMAHGGTAELDQLVPEEGISFKTTSISGEFEDLNIGDFIDIIGDDAGFDVIRSDSFDAESLEDGHSKTIPAGMSLHQFLRQLAIDNNAKYTVIENALTGKPTLIFINQEEFKESTIVPKELMTYKGPGSLLKSVNITAAFSKATGHSNVSIDKDGKMINGKSNQALTKVPVFDSVVDVKPNTGGTASPAGEGAANVIKKPNGTVQYHPSGNKPGYLKDLSSNKTACQMNGVVTLEFSCVGFPNIKPGSCPFFGLGRRYSGTYDILQVSHIIDSNGYNCRGNAVGANSGGEGVSAETKTKQENTPTENVKLFHQATNTKVPSGGLSGSISLSELIS